MAENYSIEPKEQTTFRMDKNLYNDLSNYADIKGLNKGEALNEILFKFFRGSTLTNTYLDNKAGLTFKIPLDIEFKKECIDNHVKLNQINDSMTIGDNTGRVTINQIPNNLDTFTLSDDNTAGSYLSNINGGVLHSGIDFIFIPEAMKKPTTILKDKLDIDVMDYIYCFYFEVTTDNKTDVYLIDYMEAINRLSDVNNRITGDSLIDMVEMLEDHQITTNRNYKESMADLYANSKYVSNKNQMACLDTAYLFLTMYLPSFENSNITFKTAESLEDSQGEAIAEINRQAE